MTLATFVAAITLVAQVFGCGLRYLSRAPPPHPWACWRSSGIGAAGRVNDFAPPLFPIARVLGAALIGAGLPILLDSFARFALQGLGTPAPVMPPECLVVTGFYRYVRNPMYVAVTALIAGQGLLFGSVTVLAYGAIVWAGFFLLVLAHEEPALGEQFADEYKRYRANVRRWLPRITPWRG